MITIRLSDEELFIRRRRIRILYYLLKSHKKSEIIDKVSSDFNCLESTVVRDIGIMNEWIMDILPLADSENVAFVLLKLEYQILTKVLEKIASENNSQIGFYAVKSMSNLWESQFKLRMQLK